MLAGLAAIDPARSVRDEVLALCAQHISADVATLRPDAYLEELGICSVDLASLVFVIERRLGVDLQFEDDDAEPLPIDTMGDLLAIVERSLGPAR